MKALTPDSVRRTGTQENCNEWKCEMKRFRGRRAPITGGINPDAMKRMEGMHPIGRMSGPEEIDKAVPFLWSDESSFVTGQYLKVDGGFTGP